MIPIRDHNPSLRIPFVTYALIGLNVAVFVAMWPLRGDEYALATLYHTYGVVPESLLRGEGLRGLITSMFVHGGFLHLAGNMLFLWIFGDNLEELLGHLRFIIFYLAAGLGAAILQVMADPSSPVPMVGASGAIAGVMGAYLLLFPRARVDVLFFFLVFFKIIPIPAWLMLLAWFGLQIWGGVANFGADGGVAYWAHAGGFITGFLFVWPLWASLGGVRFWSRTEGHPDHPAAQYQLQQTSVPRVRRRK